MYDFVWVRFIMPYTNILRVITFLLTFIIIISAIWIVYKIIVECTIFQSPSKIGRILWIGLFVLILIVHILAYVLFSQQKMTTKGIYQIQEITTKDNQCVFIVKDPTSNQIVNLYGTAAQCCELNLNINTFYYISYRWLHYQSDRGYIEGEIKLIE